MELKFPPLTDEPLSLLPQTVHQRFVGMLQQGHCIYAKTGEMERENVDEIGQNFILGLFPNSESISRKGHS